MICVKRQNILKTLVVLPHSLFLNTFFNPNNIELQCLKLTVICLEMKGSLVTSVADGRLSGSFVSILGKEKMKSKYMSDIHCSTFVLGHILIGYKFSNFHTKLHFKIPHID